MSTIDMAALARTLEALARVTCLALILAFILGPARAQTVDFGRYHALVVGNNDYADLPKLKNAAADAQAVERLLKDKYGFDTTLLLNATRDQIVRALNDQRAALTERDNLLIYYAGHGTLDGDVGFWQGIDAEPNYEDNWVPISDLTRNLRAMSARHVMVVADSCYSGTLTRDAPATLATGEERQAWLQRMAGRRSRTAMSSGDIEKVLDGGGRGHSIFAQAFLDALEDNEGVLDGQALFDSIKGKIVLETVQTPQYSDIRFAEHAGGDFLFVPREVQMAAVAEQHSFGPQRGAGGDVGEDSKVWSVIQHSTSPIDLQTFIESFPDSIWIPFARNRLAKLAADESSQELALAPSEVGREIVPSPVQPAVGVFPDLLAPSGRFRDCPECPEMVVVPAGSFLMGGPPDELGVGTFEVPQHQVTIAEPFAVSKYEVTFDEWDACVKDGGCRYSPRDQWGRNRQPVINVSWNDVVAEYLPWLSRRTERAYRFLSEAEWEYAARASTATPFAFGSTIATDQANYNGNYSYGIGPKGPYREQTVAVDALPANAWGLHQMHGNVSELVADCKHFGYKGAPSDGSVWGPLGRCIVIVRGGSWRDPPVRLRSAHRDAVNPGGRTAYIGFRVARAID